MQITTCPPPLPSIVGTLIQKAQHYLPIIVQKSLPDIGVQKKSFQPFIISCPFQEVQILDLLRKMPQIHLEWGTADGMPQHKR